MQISRASTPTEATDPLLRLSADIWGNSIFPYLDANTLYSVCLVCKTWYAILNQTPSWQQLMTELSTPGEQLRESSEAPIEPREDFEAPTEYRNSDSSPLQQCMHLGRFSQKHVSAIVLSSGGSPAADAGWPIRPVSIVNSHFAGWVSSWKGKVIFHQGGGNAYTIRGTKTQGSVYALGAIPLSSGEQGLVVTWNNGHTTLYEPQGSAAQFVSTPLMQTAGSSGPIPLSLPDGRFLALLGSGEVELHKLNDEGTVQSVTHLEGFRGELIRLIGCQHSGQGYVLGIDKQHNLMAWDVSEDRGDWIWQMRLSGNNKRSLVNESAALTAVRDTSGNDQILSLSSKGQLVLLDPRSGETQLTLSSDSSILKVDIATTAGKEPYAIVLSDRKIRIYSLSSGMRLWSCPNARHFTLIHSPGGPYLLAAGLHPFGNSQGSPHNDVIVQRWQLFQGERLHPELLGENRDCFEKYSNLSSSEFEQSLNRSFGQSRKKPKTYRKIWLFEVPSGVLLCTKVNAGSVRDRDLTRSAFQVTARLWRFDKPPRNRIVTVVRMGARMLDHIRRRPSTLAYEALDDT